MHLLLPQSVQIETRHIPWPAKRKASSRPEAFASPSTEIWVSMIKQPSSSSSPLPSLPSLHQPASKTGTADAEGRNLNKKTTGILQQVENAVSPSFQTKHDQSVLNGTFLREHDEGNHKQKDDHLLIQILRTQYH